MNVFSAIDLKNKRSPANKVELHYLVLSAEPKDVKAASRGTFGFRNRYLAKRRVIRTIHRLRRERA